nr:MAG TPA: hypothetical protein [Caudoviricetes sp.]
MTFTILSDTTLTFGSSFSCHNDTSSKKKITKIVKCQFIHPASLKVPL